MMVAHISFHLPFLSAIICLTPSLFSFNLYKPLLGSSYKRLEKLDEEVSDSFLPKNSIKYSPAGTSTENLRGVNSILFKTTGALKSLLIPQTSTQERLSTSWEICFGVAQKAQESESHEVKSLASAVMHLGSRFGLHQCDTQAEVEHMISTINVFYLSLENDSMNTAERIWSVMVLSFLRSKIPEHMTTAIPKVWEAKDLGRPRGHFLLFFLQNKDLGRVIEEMWSNPHLETSENVIQEAIERESIVHHIQRQIGMPSVRPSVDFQRIYLAFINLNSPIDPQKASSLIELISSHLDRRKIQNKNGFDERKNTIRLLLHLEEHHHESYLKFKDLTKKEKLCEQIVTNDVRFQLEERQPPALRALMQRFKYVDNVDVQQIRKTLQVLVEEAQISISPAGRCLRVLNLLSKLKPNIYSLLDRRLNADPQMVPKLYNKLLEYRRGRMDPVWFASKDLEYLILSKNEDQDAEKYRNNLANVLVSKGVLIKGEVTGAKYGAIGRCFEGYKETIMLYGIFKKMLLLKAQSYAHHEPNTDQVLVEYILHVISFKNKDKKLYRHLLADKHDPEVFPLHHTLVFQKLSKTVLDFVYDQSWDRSGRIDTFHHALERLEKNLSEQFEEPKGLVYMC